MGTTRSFIEINTINHFWARYGGYARPYAEYEFAYRFGCELAEDPLYDSDDWLLVEMRMMRVWRERFPGKEWREFRDAVKFAWKAARC